MPVERNEGLPYKGSGNTLKKKWKKLTGKLPSPTVSRKHMDTHGTTETDSPLANQSDVGKPVTIRMHSREQLEAEGKTVRAHLQYMQVFFKDGMVSKDYSPVPNLTETILSSIKNFLDVTNTLLKAVRSPELRDSKEMAYRRRIELLKGLAQLVRWADSLYLRESRPKIDTDPSDIYFDPIAEAVKNLVTNVSSLCQQQTSSPDESAFRIRHRSLPSVKMDMFIPPVTSITPGPPRMVASRSTENILEAEAAIPQRNMMTSSESDGQISRYVDDSTRSASDSVQSKLNLSPRMRRHENSPLTRRRPLNSTGSSIDRLSDASVDSSNELTDTSSGSSPNPPHVDNEDDEKPPPLPIKKQRNSVSTESDVSATDRPGFLPLYIDDRAKVQYGITGQDQGVETESRAPLQAKYASSVGAHLTNPSFRRSAEPVTRRGPMKATVNVLSGMNGVQPVVHAGLPDNHTAIRRQQLTGHVPILLTPVVVADVGEQPPPKPPRIQSVASSSKFLPVQIDLSNISVSVSDASTIDDDSPGNTSTGSDSTLTNFDVSSPMHSGSASVPASPVTFDVPSSPCFDMSDTLSPPLKPPRLPSKTSSRPAKPPRPPTPVKLPDRSSFTDEQTPPPLPLKKKHVAKYSEMFAGQEYIAPVDDEYDQPLYYQPSQFPGVVDWNKLPMSPRVTEFNHKSTDKAPPLPAKKKSMDRKMSFQYKAQIAITSDAKLSTSDPNVLNSVNFEERGSDSEEPSCDRDRAGPPQPLLLSPDKLSKYLLFNEGAASGGRVLRGGTVDALIACACAAKETGPEGPYFEAFLMTYRTFVSSETVLDKILESSDFYLSKSDQLASRNTLSLLMRVVDYLSNELNQEITDRLIDVVYRLLCDDELQLAVLLRQKLIQKWKALHELRVHPLAYLRTVPDPTSRAKKMTDFKSRQFAEQMSLLDMKFFQNIEVHEMLLWAEEQNEEKNPSLTAFTAHFNNVSGWCRTQLMLNKDPKEREKVALKLLKVMKHLRLMNNFNSYLAILSAVDSAAISRLDWSDEVIKGLEEPHALIDNTSSFKAYRTALKNAIPPCIPYIGMFLQDLTFLHLGSPSFLDKEKKFVNFTKRWKQFNILKKIRQCQQVEYQFERDEAVVRVFNKFENYLGDEQIYQRSLQYKPRLF